MPKPKSKLKKKSHMSKLKNLNIPKNEIDKFNQTIFGQNLSKK